MTNGNEPISPASVERSLYDPTNPDDINCGMSVTDQFSGLTKREYFAGVAMQGMLSDRASVTNMDSLCATAVRYSDILIEALNTPKP